MPKIKLSSKLGVELISAQSGPGSGISRYFSGDPAAFVASSELALALNKPITAFTAGPLGLAMSFASDGQFASGATSWNFSAGANATVLAAQSGATLPGDELFGHPVIAAPGNTIVAVAFTPSLAFSSTSSLGQLQFGFSAGGSLSFRTARTFDVTTPPTLAASLESILTSAAIPANHQDLAAMRPGDVASISGSGALKFSAAFDLAQAFNPLASPTLPLKQIGKISLQAGASLQVQAGVSLQGAYQVRVHKLDPATVRLGYHKLADSQFQFGVTASAGVSVTAGKTELLTKLMSMLGDPELDKIALVEAGLDDDQINDLQTAVEASLSRSIAVSLAATFAIDNSRSQIFEYEFDLTLLDAAGQAALDSALQGDLSPLTANSLPAGSRLLTSELDTVRTRRFTWKLNLLGLVNVLHISELVLHGNALFNAETGELVITDEAAARKIRVETRPLEAKTDKLHKLLMQSLVLTAAYRASGAQPPSATFSGSMSYYSQVANANRRTISDFLDNILGIGLISPTDKSDFLANTFQGPASIFIDAAFNDANFQSMFLDNTGNAFDAPYYDRIGRDAIAKIIQPGDDNDFRRLPMLVGNPTSDALWNSMSSAGQPSLSHVLPPPNNFGPRLAILTHDYTVIKWWSASMARAAKAVREMKTFLSTAGQTAEQLQSDPAFQSRRDRLADALAGVANDALPNFLDAWGVLAMDAAAIHRSVIRALLVTTGPILVKQRP